MSHYSAHASYLRNFVFGVEDSLVSTVGLLSGIAIAGVSRETLFLTGIVLIFVEAFSMAAGSFLAEASAESYTEGTERASRRTYFSGAIMFVSYFISGFIPLAPYMFLSTGAAFFASIVFSLIALAALGMFGAVVSRTNVFKSIVRMLVVGGIAIGIGVVVGSVTGVL